MDWNDKKQVEGIANSLGAEVVPHAFNPRAWAIEVTDDDGVTLVTAADEADVTDEAWVSFYGDGLDHAPTRGNTISVALLAEVLA